MTLLGGVLLHLAIAVAGVSAVWIVQLRTRNAGVIDAAWPLLIGAGAVLYAVVAPGDAAARAAVATLGACWALRLGGYLASRNVGKPEERRYAELRRRWGRVANRRMYAFFLFQAAIAWIVAFSFLPVAWRPDAPALAWLLGGVAVGATGIAGEAVADRQLRRFRADPVNRGQVCDVGLWRYSRHPNYFFECVHWLAYPILAIGAPFGWAAAIGAIVITVLLVSISGIPSVEGGDAASRRQGYADYVRRTSAFILWPPKVRKE